MSQAYVDIATKMNSMQEEIEALSIVVAVLYCVTFILILVLLWLCLRRKRRPLQEEVSLSGTTVEMKSDIVE